MRLRSDCGGSNTVPASRTYFVFLGAPNLRNSDFSPQRTVGSGRALLLLSFDFYLRLISVSHRVRRPHGDKEWLRFFREQRAEMQSTFVAIRQKIADAQVATRNLDAKAKRLEEEKAEADRRFDAAHAKCVEVEGADHGQGARPVRRGESSAVGEIEDGTSLKACSARTSTSRGFSNRRGKRSRSCRSARRRCT